MCKTNVEGHPDNTHMPQNVYDIKHLRNWMTINGRTTIDWPAFDIAIKMQGILFFITTFSHGLAKERSLPDLEDTILLAADVRKLPSAEENRVPNLEDDDCNCDNVNEILRELSEERVKNRDLNQTI